MLVHLFIEALLPSNITLFQPGNGLYVVQEKCCAIMIQYYLEVRKDLGFLNVIATKMHKTANMVNLSDPKQLIESNSVVSSLALLVPTSS